MNGVVVPNAGERTINKMVEKYLKSTEEIISATNGEILSVDYFTDYQDHERLEGGMFCPKVFGDVEVQACRCGKLYSDDHIGLFCDECRSRAIFSSFKESRLGYIKLAKPVVNYLYYGFTSCISLLLPMSQEQLKEVVMREKFVVIEPGESSYSFCDTLNDEEYWEFLEEFGDECGVVSTGAEAVKVLLSNLDIEEELKITNSNVKLLGCDVEVSREKEKIKILRALKKFDKSAGNMVLEVLPILPPFQKPFRFSVKSCVNIDFDVQGLVRSIVFANSRLLRYFDMGAPDFLTNREVQRLQCLIDLYVGFFCVSKGQRRDFIKRIIVE